MNTGIDPGTNLTETGESSKIGSTTFSVYGYRWVVLVVFMFAIIMNQLLWISFAPITGEAAAFYGVSDLSIGLLSMSFMVVYILVSIPASWVIDNFGIRTAVGIGASLTGAFGLMRGLVADSYTLVLVAQIGIAIGQPFILNAITKVAARWFPLQERATASGFGSLAIYLGIAAGMILTPFLTLQLGIETMLAAPRRLAKVLGIVREQRDGMEHAWATIEGPPPLAVRCAPDVDTEELCPVCPGEPVWVWLLESEGSVVVGGRVTPPPLLQASLGQEMAFEGQAFLNSEQLFLKSFEGHSLCLCSMAARHRQSQSSVCGCDRRSLERRCCF